MNLTLDRERFVSTMKAQAEIGGTDGGGLHRLTLSDDDKEIRDWFAEQMDAEGLETRVDTFGNMFGRRAGTDPDAKPVMVGSHLDSQPYGGIYDGALGVIAALEFVRTLNDEGIETTHPIEVVNWTNEEGSRFQPTMQGSGVWVGEHDLDEEYRKTDEAGHTVEEALEAIGYKGSVPAEPREPYDSYLELHIEQGPFLDEGGYDVGTVTGVVGLVWGATTFRGQANHSGSTPMAYRSDALVAAADFITGVRRLAATLGPETVGTVGFVDAEPNSINVIPGEVTVTWGFRDPDDAVLEEALERVRNESESAARREGVEWECEERSRAGSVRFPDRIVEAVESSAANRGHDHARLFSGGVHDAAHLTAVCDSGIVFAVSEDGKSHTESEYTSWADCYAAADTYANAGLALATEGPT